MRVFGIAGFKNAGKTTLVVALLQELRQRGLQIATIKHAHHEFDIDHPGKDSYQHRLAGAREVIISSSRRWAHICELRDEEPTLQQLLARLGDVDLVLIEGYKHGEHPKLEVRRDGQTHPELAATDPTVVAIVSDKAEPDASVPVFARQNVRAIADLIEQHAIAVN